MEEQKKNLRRGTRFILPVIVLICGFAATALATYLVNENIGFRNRQRIKEAAHQIDRTVKSRMEAYIGLLRGGAGLFAANQFVTLEQFRRFYQRLEIEERYPGLQGFGYTVHFPAEKLEPLISMMQRQGMSNFNVWPEEPRDQYHSIVFLEPFDERNQKALGYDMFTEPARRRAMESARDSGDPRITMRVELVQERGDANKQAGFLVYMPIYLTGNVPLEVAERRSQLQGFVYSPFRAGDLFGAMFARVTLPGLAYAIWDGTGTGDKSLLYQSDPRFKLSSDKDLTPIELPGTRWMLGICEFPVSGAAADDRMLYIVPILGVIASLLLCFFTYSEGKARSRSELVANELFNQREWLQTTLGSIGDAVISTDTKGNVQFLNPVAEQLTGWRHEEAQSRPLVEVFPVQKPGATKIENPVAQVLASGETVRLSGEVVLTDRSGSKRWIDDSAAPIRDRHGAVIGAALVFRDVSERRRYERRSSAQHAATEVLAESPSSSDAAERLLKALCEKLGFEIGVFWMFDEASGRAEAAYQWHGPDERFNPFIKACVVLKPGRGEELPGTVWKDGEPRWVTDFNADQKFQRRPEASDLGLVTAVAFPVVSDSVTFGAIELFARERREPDQELLNVLGGIGAQFGLFIQRKRAEQALAESEELYRAISDTAADGIVVIDEHSKILTVNGAVERIFGYEPGALIGESLTKLMPARMHDTHRTGMRRFVKTGEKKIAWNGVELPGLHCDGREIPLEISFGVASRGDHYLFTGLIRDITRRKESEKQLRDTEERFGLLVRLAEEYAIITMDREGRVTTWNSGAQHIFRYTDEEAIGRDAGIFFTTEDQAAGLPQFQLKKAETEGQVLDERWQTRKDGSRFWASGSVVCLRSEEGTVRGFAKILRDITERKNVEESIRELNQELEIRVQRRTAALQESKEQMEAFSYTVAHDLRAPLRAMQGFAHVLVDEYEAKLERSAVDYLRRIMGSAQRMDALIQDLLSYSQLSRSDLSFKAVRVDEAVQNALREHEHEILRTRAEVRSSVNHLAVKAHAATLENAIGNLISNALKFCPADETPRLTIRSIDQGEFVQISVQDNGIGIAPEHQDRIFRVFERLHGQQSFPGTGIGLAIVKKGVERMGGRVGVASEKGQGSLFWIELPKDSPPPLG